MARRVMDTKNDPIPEQGKSPTPAATIRTNFGRKIAADKPKDKSKAGKKTQRRP